MPMHKSLRHANNLMQDDHFKFAGTMFRVTSVAYDKFDNTIITATEKNGDPLVNLIVTVDPNLELEIFNQ